MQPEQLASLIEQGIPGAKAEVSNEGDKYFATIVSDAFEGKTPVQEHKMVYALVDEHIKSGAIHALSIKALTPAEWQQQSG